MNLKTLLLIIILFLLSGCSKPEVNITNDLLQEENSEIIYVELKGKVSFPGIYEINNSKYLYEIIEMAGGLLDSADVENINLVQLINVSCSITIPEKVKIEKPALININYASLEQLITLPGIGQVLAEKIIEYRKTKGLFLTIEQIKEIPGIKDSVFNQIKDRITI